MECGLTLTPPNCLTVIPNCYSPAVGFFFEKNKITLSGNGQKSDLARPEWHTTRTEVPGRVRSGLRVLVVETL